VASVSVKVVFALTGLCGTGILPMWSGGRKPLPPSTVIHQIPELRFNYHCFVKKGAYAYDSCSAMSSVYIKEDYATCIAAGSPDPTSVESDLIYPIE
jgi:hypothetical protein